MRLLCGVSITLPSNKIANLAPPGWAAACRHADETISPSQWDALRFDPLGSTPLPGIVVAPSLYRAWLRIISMRLPLSSQSFSKQIALLGR